MILLPLALLTGCRHHAEAPSEGSLFGKYALRQDLTVAQLNGFRLNDSVNVDVVMLQADNDSAWLQLTEEFDIRGGEGSASWLADTADAALRTAWTGEPVLRVVASPQRRTVAFYRIDTEMQYDALLDYQLNKVKNGK